MNFEYFSYHGVVKDRGVSCFLHIYIASFSKRIVHRGVSISFQWINLSTASPAVESSD